MLKLVRDSMLAATALAASIAAAPERAQAQTYQIDCAILLCLSGGWPASIPCARARAEFIRRITPWPIEPPLQIWRCPMGAAYTVDQKKMTGDRIYDILLKLNDAPALSVPSAPLTNPALEIQPAVVRRNGGTATPLPNGFTTHLAQAVGKGADIDISYPEFNFVRSINVFHIVLRQGETGRDNSCSRSSNVRHGQYGTNGQFAWGTADWTQIPAAYAGDERFGSHCPDVRENAVFVEWKDYEGKYGFEQVNY